MRQRAAIDHFDRVAQRLRAYAADTQDVSRPESQTHPVSEDIHSRPQPMSGRLGGDEESEADRRDQPDDRGFAAASDEQIRRIAHDVVDRVRRSLADDLAGPLAALRADFDEWRSRNEPKVGHLETRLEAIRDRIDALASTPDADKAALAALVSPLDQRLDQITATFEDKAEAQALHLEAIGAAVERLQNDGPSAALIEALREELQRLMERLDDDEAPLADVVDRTARELTSQFEALRAQVLREIARTAQDAARDDHGSPLAADGPAADLAAALTRSIAEIREQQVDGARRTSDGLDLVRRTLADLSTRLRSIEDELSPRQIRSREASLRDNSPPRPPVHRLGPFGATERPRPFERAAPLDLSRVATSHDAGLRTPPLVRDTPPASQEAQPGPVMPDAAPLPVSPAPQAGGADETTGEAPATAFVAGATIAQDDLKGRFIAAARRASASQPLIVSNPPASNAAPAPEPPPSQAVPAIAETSEEASSSTVAEETSAFGRLRRSFGRRRGVALGIGGVALAAGVSAGLTGWEPPAADRATVVAASADAPATADTPPPPLAPAIQAAVPARHPEAAPTDPSALPASASADDFEARMASGRASPWELKLAAKLLTRAADLGIVPAMYRVGRLYEKGLGVERDRAAARNWYEQAALRGNVKAMHNLAVLLADPSDGRPDYAGASEWFRKAASYGLNDSQFNLAVLLARGLGTGASPVEALTWFSILAAQGDQEAGQRGDEIARSLTSAELESAQAAARRWRPQPLDRTANDPFLVDARALSADRLREKLKAGNPLKAS